MFGFLKKKLKEGIDKISKTLTKKEEEKIEEAVEEIKKEEHIEEKTQELVKEVEKEIKFEEPKPEEKPKEGIKETEDKLAEISKKEELVIPQEKIVEEKPIEIKEEKKIEAPKEEIEPEIKIEKAVEEKIEEAKKIIETAKEIEHIEEKPLEKKVEERLILIEKKIEEKKEEKPKRKFFERILKRKPKEEIKPKVEEPKAVEEKIEKGILEKIKQKITEKKIEEDDVKDILKDLEMSLIESDVAVEVADKICNDLKSNLVGKFIKRKEIENIIKKSFRDSILDILKVESFDLLERAKTKKPFVIVFLGFNGSGKTTSIARVGYLLKKNDFSCVFAAADCYRAASIEQLEEHGKKLGIEVIKHKYGADPAAVIFDAVKHAKAKDIDIVLADTAGRSHANVNLMDELKKIIKVNKPDLKILVLDALTGNDIYDQCKMFNDAVGVDALIITKADVYEKGGATLSASHTISRPILYLGVGQEYKDLEKFDSNKIVEKLLD
jgi:fused signal recognition particle receptor